jgi:hypothetical protein
MIIEELYNRKTKKRNVQHRKSRRSYLHRRWRLCTLGRSIRVPFRSIEKRLADRDLEFVVDSVVLRLEE